MGPGENEKWGFVKIHVEILIVREINQWGFKYV